MQNRPYQLTQVNKTCEKVSTKRKVVMQLPTGGGKTVEFCMIIDRFIKKTGESVLILVHREELMYQAKKTIKDMLNIDAVLITSETTHYKVARVYIGMVESLVRRLDCFSEVHLVIVDEAHINSFNKIHNIFLEELVIGVTATPISAVKREPVNKYYYDIITGPQINELIAGGYLSQNRTICPKDIVDASKFQISSLYGDYNTLQMAAEYKLPRYVRNVVVEYEKWCEGEKTLVFNVNIEHSREVAKCLSFCGYPAKHLGSDNNSERHEILKWFKETEDAILCNVGVATVGFNEPTVRKIINNYSTLSLAKHIQTSGRGSRVIDDAWLEKYQCEYPYIVKKKNTFDIIDLGGNWARFGDWNADRDWEYIFNYPAEVRNGLAPVKTCPQCDGLLHAAIKICPLTNAEGEMCLYEFESRRPKETGYIKEMIIVTGGESVEQIAERNKNKYDYYTMNDLATGPTKIISNTFGRNPNQEVIDRYFKIYYELVIQWWNKVMSNREDCIEDISNSGYHIRKAQNNFNALLKKYGINGEHKKLYDWNKTEELSQQDDDTWSKQFLEIAG